MGIGEFNSDDHNIYYCGKWLLRRNEAALVVNKRVWNSVLQCSFKDDRKILVDFQDKSFNITLIQVYAPNSKLWCWRSWSQMVLWRPKRPFRTNTCIYQFSSVHFSLSVMSDSLRPHESQHARLPCTSSSPGVHTDSRPSSQWCHPAISFSVIPFSSCPQSLPASESFPMSQLFAWGGQNTGVSALASFLPKKSQGWSPSEWTGWISLQSKELSRVFSNTTVQKHQFFGTQLSSQSNSHIHTWLLEKP